ncbi:MAG: HAD family hydrolase [Luteolibacter sp.]
MRIAIVHYHLAPGGVTSVIESGSQALTSAGIRHVILTGSSGISPQSVARASHPEHRQIEALGYLTQPGDLTADSLLTSLRAAATDALGAPPDIWHFHNHSLGKNCLIADVVARLANEQERLILQIHDLAESGRPENYPLIADSQNIYPFSARIHYAFLNTRDLKIFTGAGLPQENTTVLANPVPCPDPHLRGKIHGSRSILFAPIRGIRRKNLGELVLLSALAPVGANFAISRAPQNPRALPIHDTWRKFARKHRLPIEFDVVDHFSPTVGASAGFESWVRHATHFVTTSVAEGFGLPFLESIAHRKPLIGRNLAHLAGEHARHDIRSGRLYERILVPIDWIDSSIFAGYLTTTLERNHRFYQRPLSNETISATYDALVHDGYLDFGNLPEPLQQGVIEKLTEKANRPIPLVEANGNTRPLEDWLAEVIAQHIPTATQDQLAPYSLGVYEKNLTNLYQYIARQPASPVLHLPAAEILTAHLTPQSFHFLLSALEPIPVPVKFRAVIFDIYGTLLIAPAGGVKPDSLTDPVLREILRNFGHEPPTSPSSELHAAVLRHHAAAGVSFPEIDLRVLWREILSLPADADVAPLVEALEAAWHPTRPMHGAEKFIQQLARSGISLGLLSNAQCNTLPSLGSISHLFAPELSLLSYQHGIAKPAPELFQIMTDRLAGRNISPADTLFIGNDPLHDILPAATAGFRTALFTGHPDSLRPGACSPDFTFQSWAELRALF